MKWRTASYVVLILALGSFARLQSQETRPNESVSASFPDKNWEVKIDSPGFAVQSAGPNQMAANIFWRVTRRPELFYR